MARELSFKTITEPAREIKVCREADVVVVGGGPGGIGSAIAAARNGARTVLIERYGHLGGMATGGLVNIIPNLSDISGKQHLYGLNQEIIDRVQKIESEEAMANLVEKAITASSLDELELKLRACVRSIDLPCYKNS